jgi:replicative DNA helicase
VPTGFPDVDRHIKAGGWERRGFTIILAPTKRGKTAFMLQSAMMSSATYGQNWLYITLEVSEDGATDRLDAAATGINIDDLAARSADVAALVNGMAASPRRGDLWLMRRPGNSLTTAGLESIIERHIGQGRKLDAVVVDYMGIMKTRPEYRYEDLGHIAKELRRIADVHDVAMLSGYQTNRDGLAKQVSGAEHMGDSFTPAQDCDLMISINADEAELRAGVRRLHWVLARNEAQVTLKVQGDLAKARLIESVIGTIL